MSSHPLRTALLRTAAALTVPGVLLATAGPAAAGPKDSTSTKRSATTAVVDWTEYDLANALGLPGNVHTGYLEVTKDARSTYLFGAITDWQCDPGEVPGGGHGEPGGPASCDAVQQRSLYSDTMTLAVDTRAGTALATGTITVTNGGHGEPAPPTTSPVTVPARIELRSTSGMSSFTRTETWQEGTYTYRSRVRGLSSGQTVVGGALGRMGFADDVDDASYGYFQTSTEVSRERIG